MAAKTELANIEQVDLREVWQNEAEDFTPWLADNIELLGKALGMDLEVTAQEARVGNRYSLDILARDPGRDRPVVIENQLEDTDHSHLGQLLTYAAGFDANVIVWIAKEFEDEHRDALDLLNRRTGEDSEFFGVEVELLKIGDSPPAVNFKLVVTPNEWHKQTMRSGVGVSERGERYRKFFQRLVDTMTEKHRFKNASKVGTENYFDFRSGHSYVLYGAGFTGEGMARVEIYIDKDKDWNKRLFDRLKEDKTAVESELGELDWQRLDDRNASRIRAARQGSIKDDEETLAEIQDWMVERFLAFKRVFGPRLAEFKE